MLDPNLIIQYLNSLLLLDPEAIKTLVDFRVPANQKLANHETVQVLKTDDETGAEYLVGLLGILNGLCGIDEDGWGYIVAVCDESDNIIKFIHKKDRDK